MGYPRTPIHHRLKIKTNICCIGSIFEYKKHLGKVIRNKSIMQFLDQLYPKKLRYFFRNVKYMADKYCVKSVLIRSYSDSHFPAFRLNTERDFVSLRIQSEWGKMRIRITPNADKFHAMKCILLF